MSNRYTSWQLCFDNKYRTQNNNCWSFDWDGLKCHQSNENSVSELSGKLLTELLNLSVGTFYCLVQTIVRWHVSLKQFRLTAAAGVTIFNLTIYWLYNLLSQTLVYRSINTQYMCVVCSFKFSQIDVSMLLVTQIWLRRPLFSSRHFWCLQ